MTELPSLDEIRADVKRIRDALFGDGFRPGVLQALYGDGKEDKGLVEEVKMLVETADRRNWAFKTVLWIGGGIVAALTALGQLRTAWVAFWGHSG